MADHHHAFQLTLSCALRWTASDAFKELYRNWKHAILTASALETCDFTPIISEDGGSISVAVGHKDHINGRPKQWGWIRWDRHREDVEIVNVGIPFQGDFLDLGYSTQLEAAGVGLPFAAVALVRNGYCLSITCESRHWNLETADGFLVCRISNDLSDEQDPSWPSIDEVDSAEPRVVIRVGPRDPSTGARVTEDIFRCWLRTTIDIFRPVELVQTRYGDLLFDAEHANRLYLRGVALSSAYSPARQYRYGYNFHSGERDGEHQRLADIDWEARLVTMIWDAALQQHAYLLPRYIAMLEHVAAAPDVERADQLLSSAVATRIWTMLRAKAHACRRFYLRETHVLAESSLVQEQLKLTPRPMSTRLWRLLRQHTSIRKPRDELIRQFRSGAPVSIPDHPFSRHVDRTLRAALQLYPLTQGVRLVFVHVTDARVDVTFDPGSRTLYVHEKWLDGRAALRDAGYEEVTEAALEYGFVCDRRLGDLYRVAVQRITEESHRVASPLVGMTPWAQRRVEEKIRQMPRMIQMTPTPDSYGIHVTWSDGDSQSLVRLRGHDSYFRVTLHDWETCAAKAETLLHDRFATVTDIDDRQRISASACLCSTQLVSQASSGIEFHHLSPAKRYFPMIAREAHHSFLGTTLAPMYPNASHALRPLPREPALTDAILAQYDAYRESQSWQDWHATHFQASFDQLRPPGYYGETSSPDLHRVESYGALRTGTYIEISLSDIDSTLAPMLSVLFVHELLVPRAASSPDIAPKLVATRFSYLHSSAAFMAANDLIPCELLLHFRDDQRMGEREDAETFALGPPWSDSQSPNRARVLSPIVYVSSLVGNSAVSFPDQPFCRYAIQAGVDTSFACIQPVATHLLQRRPVWPHLSHSVAPVVLDLTPDDVGMSEGFRQAGCQVRIGIGFDRTRHQTWLNLNAAATVFDGDAATVIAELNCDALPLPSFDSNAPRIALISGGRQPWDFTSDHAHAGERMLESLTLLTTAATSSSLAADILLWVGHWSIFHNELFPVLSETLLVLLGEGLAVHVWDVSVADDGSEGARDVVVILAAPAAVRSSWVRDLYFDLTTTHCPSSRDDVDDLDFENPRAMVDPRLDLTGRKDAPSWHTDSIPPALVYNHRTGLFCNEAPARQRPAMAHPFRGDLYTVREMARMKGFDDHSRFLEATLQEQYAQVWEACPPRLSRSLAILLSHLTALMALQREGHASVAHFLPQPVAL